MKEEAYCKSVSSCEVWKEGTTLSMKWSVQVEPK